MKTVPIKIGDKFNRNGGVVEVVGTKPGGRIELFDNGNKISTDRWHKEVIKWEKLN